MSKLNIKYFFIFHLAVFCAILGCFQFAYGQSNNSLPAGVQLYASVDASKIVVGDPFIYTVVLSGTIQFDSYSLPAFSQVPGLSVIEGPSSNVAMEQRNGISKVTRSYSVKLLTSEKGKFTIPAAEIKYHGTSYFTDPIDIEVTDIPVSDKMADGVISARTNEASVNEQLRGKYFALMEIPENIYRGQVVPVEIYVYRTQEVPAFRRGVQVAGGGGRDFIAPSMDSQGYTVQSDRWEQIKFSGKPFLRNLAYTMYVVPTKAGTLKLDPPDIQIQLPIASRNTDPFFNNFLGPQSIAALLPMRSQEVEVKPIPEKPDNAVMQVIGDVEVNLTTDRNALPQREVATVKLDIFGKGFLDLISAPEIEAPEHFLKLDTETNSQSRVVNGMFLSRKTFDYLFQATSPGEASVPSIDIAVFDPTTGEQKIISTEPINFNITPSDSSSVLLAGEITDENATPAERKKAEAKLLGQDVSYIEEAPLSANAINRKKPFYVQPWYWFVQFIPFGIAVLGGIIAVKSRIGGVETAESRMSKGRKAAIQALRSARQKITGTSKDDFYATLSNAIMTYCASMLGRPSAGLTLEEVEEQMQLRKFSPETISELTSVLKECDLLRFSPAEDTEVGRKSSLERAELALEKIEKERKG